MISKATHITKTILGLTVCAVALGSAGNALAGGGPRPAGLQLQSRPAGLQFQSQPTLYRFGGSRVAGLALQATHHRGLQFQSLRTAGHPLLTWRPGAKLQFVFPKPGGSPYGHGHMLTTLANGPW